MEIIMKHKEPSYWDKRIEKMVKSTIDEPTWGVQIPGYSYPSIRQEQLFKKCTKIILKTD